MTVFVDTSALIAVIYEGDQGHQGAARVWVDLINSRSPLATTNYVLLETAALLQRRLGLEAVRALTTQIVPLLEVHWVNENVHRAGVTAVLTAGRRQLSLVDCISFEVMRILGLRQALALDVDFTDQGFETLP